MSKAIVKGWTKGIVYAGTIEECELFVGTNECEGPDVTGHYEVEIIDDGDDSSEYDFSTIREEQVDIVAGDTLHVPHSAGQFADGQFLIWSDDGNESSYGQEKWSFHDGIVTLIEEYGRDCFDGLLSTKIFGEMYHPITNAGKSCSVETFRAMLSQHKDSWQARTDEYIEMLGEE